MSRSVAIIGTRGYPSYYGGFETAVRKIAPYLAEQGWDVTVYGRDGSTRPDDPEIDRRVRTVVTPGIESKSLSTLSYGLMATLHAFWKKPDVAIVMNVANGFWLPLLRLRGIPTLVNVDGIEWDRAKWGRVAKAMFRAGAKMTAWWGDRLVFDARAIGQRWRDEFGRDGDFIPYGGDAPVAREVEAPLVHREYALMVARFVPENTVSEFLDAARIIAETHDVVIVGSTGYGGPLDEQARQLGESSSRVHWLGHVSDDGRLYALWAHAGAYFHGHSVGGTNPALVQAMSCAAPTVARDTVYNREVLGETGLFVAPTTEAIVEGVQNLLSNPVLQDRLSRSAFERGRAEYSWESICASYERSARETIDASRKRDRTSSRRQHL
ncbi:glycosyltransferase [Rathayibacter sp. VKM Ac-2929]|uniref:glycosyltransferase n=1 Tax=Rathayibacter sp. VKM Ac-2929 TaxID=2929480 RepID=UPI001FB4359C|nr:glycosyltransferase [Rathayibacter sp. VKM Ac-2929]MCJ1672918.1 glycosyltransferase [Rathayibacter sp. VKM Ac-2929]